MNREEAYLTGPMGAEDVRLLLERPSLHRSWPYALFPEGRVFLKGEHKPGPWSWVRVADFRAYFRPEGDRFIVTDMGEAVRALRLRTGCRAWEASHEGVRVLPEAPFLLLGFAETHIHVDDGLAGKSGVVAVDLPRAICAVLLAAHRVAYLDLNDHLPHEGQ